MQWLIVNDESQKSMWLTSKELYGTYDFLDGANQLFKEAKLLVSEHTSVQRKLKAVFAYSNNGRATSSLENKFINAWVALESLCRGEAFDNIISNVLETVPPALCIRYIYHLFRNFIEDCRRCKVEFSFSLGKLINDSMLTREAVQKIIEIFNDSLLYQELLNKCSVNLLLEMRCVELHNIATDRQKMFDRIESHYSNVRCQLSRLYRIRNEMAHDAHNSDESILIYIEHLDDYLANLVAEIIIVTKRKHVDDIELVYEIIRDNYKEFLAIKNSKKGVDIGSLLGDFLKTGLIDLI